MWVTALLAGIGKFLASKVVGTVVNKVIDIGGTFLERRATLSELKYQGHLRLATMRAEGDARWENTWASQAATSLKDEALMIIIWTPVIMTFIPWTRPFAVEGFTAIKEHVPDIWWYAMGVTVAASFGVKEVIKRFGQSRGYQPTVPVPEFLKREARDDRRRHPEDYD